MTREIAGKTCYCHTCGKWFNPLGIMNHRRSHLNRGETVKITFTHGDTYTYSPRTAA